MSYAFVQFKTAIGSGFTIASPSLTLTAGNFVLIGLLGGFGGADVSPSGVVDAMGNTYTQVAHLDDAALFGGSCMDLWYCENVKGGTGAVTATYPSSAGFSNIYVSEYSGIVNSGSFDVANEAAGASGTPLVSVSISAAPELVGGFIFNQSGGVSTSTLTDRSGSFLGGNGVFGDELAPIHPAIVNVSSNGTSSAWMALMATFKVAPTVLPTKQPVCSVME